MAGKSIKANYIYNAAYHTLTLLTPLITTPYLSRVLEPDGIGIHSFAESLVTYFVYFTGMGISAYGQREVSYFQDNIEERSRVFWNMKCLSLINMIIFLTLYLILIFNYADENLAIYIIMSAYIITQALDVSWFFAGLEDFRKIISASILIRIGNIIFTFMFVKQKSDLIIHIAGMAFFAVLNALILCFYIPGYIRKPELKSLQPFKDIKTVWSLFLPSIAVLIYTVLDKTMIGVFTEGAFENGYYEQAMKVARLSLMLLVSFINVMTPRIGYLFGKNDSRQIQSYMYISYRFIWFLGTALCLGLVGISDNFVMWFFGKGYETVSGLLKISSLIILSSGINQITGNIYLIPTKRENIFTLTIVSGSVVNFLLNIVFIIMFRSYGAAFASFIAETVIALLQFYILRNELSFKDIVVSGKNYFISGSIMLIILRVINSYLSPSIANTFIMILSGAFVYIAVLLILRDEFFIDYSIKTFKGIASRLRR